MAYGSFRLSPPTDWRFDQRYGKPMYLSDVGDGAASMPKMGGGVSSLSDPTLAVAQMGAGLLGAGLNYLGSGDQRAYQKEARNFGRWGMNKARSAYGTDVINPTDTVWATRTAMQPRMNKLGRNLAGRYGVDSARAQGYLSDQMLSSESDAWLQAYLEDRRLRSQRDQNILGMAIGG